MPLIFRWKIIFIVSYQTMKYKFNYTPLVKFFNLNVQSVQLKPTLLKVIDALMLLIISQIYFIVSLYTHPKDKTIM